MGNRVADVILPRKCIHNIKHLIKSKDLTAALEVRDLKRTILLLEHTPPPILCK